jgi:hypothetical protein
MRVGYLLRFDDICPSMNWRVWDAVERILLDQQLDPILAVVPDNRDDTLRVSAPDGRFWDRVRGWQARGWTIAMHGWQHRFVTKDAGILRVNRYSEFAGLPRHEQERKIRAGVEVFEREGIESVIWIAPAHSFDDVTLQVLSESDFRYISDGFFLLPHVDRFGMTWIPQQLWSFRCRPYGVWTICFHINRWTSTEVLGFKESIKKYSEKISCFSAVASKYDGRQKNVFDSAAARVYRSAASMKTVMKRLARHFY